MEAKDGSFGFDFTGAYTRIVPNEFIEYDIGDRSARVEFICRRASADAAEPERVIVRVTFDAEQTHSIEQQRAGWQAILDNFARHVATKQASA
jgi:uncharacterized protein YndB with AHSA1/START domain